MNFQEVLTYLQDPIKRGEFISKLKNAGDKSKAFLNVKNAMETLNMNKPPKHYDEKTILQHTFKYANVEECLQTFRLVCKAWRDAAETLRVDRAIDFQGFKALIKKNGPPIPKYYARYFSAHKKLEIDFEFFDEPHSDEKIEFISQIKKLNSLAFTLDEGQFTAVDPTEQDFKIFIQKMINNSQKTLMSLNTFNLENTVFAMNLPKLVNLTLYIGKWTVSLEDFQAHFEIALKHMPQVKIINLAVCEDAQNICEYIAKNYAKHCITYDVQFGREDPLNDLPAKIVFGQDLENLQNQKFSSHVEYLEVTASFGMPWEQMQNIFDSFTNLKGIEFWVGGLVNFENLSKMRFSSNVEEQIWLQAIDYFHKRQIWMTGRRIMRNNEKFFQKIAKENNLKWRFDIYQS